MSKRIKDSLDVLRLIHDFFHKDRSTQIPILRTRAVNVVSRRGGIDSKTVFAHLVGKNIPSKMSARELDELLKAWLENNSMKLKEWYLRDADNQDKRSIDSFLDRKSVV